MKKLISLMFHRSGIVAMMLLVQIAVLAAMIIYFIDYFVYFYWICIFVSAIAVFWILGNKSNPGYKIAWLIPILIFPVFGGLVYLIFGGSRLSQRTRRKMQIIQRRMEQTLAPDYKAETLTPLGLDAVNQARYLERIANCPAYRDTITEYFPLGELCFARMLRELRKAKHYIFLEYFIIDEGEMWSAILDILMEKAAAGVDVRVLYDDFGTLFTLPREYAAELRALGIQCMVFNPLIPVLSLRLNNRDHRKMCIIDGRAAFTGGINLADEYINKKERFGHWKDSAILLTGEAVWGMTVMFLSIWDYVRGVEGDFAPYRPAHYPKLDTAGIVQPYVDNPLDDEEVGGTVYLNMISKAERYVYITTPYLIIDDRMNKALCNAAQSGVDVRIITPHIADKKLVFELTRAHYDPLLDAGVKIYEYTPGFMHAKNVVVDDRYGTVGTVNMDYRSFYLHFENGVWLCNDPELMAIKADFLATLEQSQQITAEGYRQRTSMIKRLLRSILRGLAPLM